MFAWSSKTRNWAVLASVLCLPVLLYPPWHNGRRAWLFSPPYYGSLDYGRLVLELAVLCLIAALVMFFSSTLPWTRLRVSITQMVTSLRPWKRLGGTVQIVTGLPLATSEATTYAPNPFFWTRMMILGLIGVHALIFRPSVYNRTYELDRLPTTPPNVKVAAILSLVLWTAMFTMGRLIAYWDSNENRSQIAG